jgi:hypothetical protein
MNFLRHHYKDVPWLLRDYTESAVVGYPMRSTFDHVERYCSFIGFSRTGSTIIGAFLNAHPNILIGHEAPDLKYLFVHYRREQLYYLLYRSARSFVEDRGVSWSNYSYAVPGQWQGRYDVIRTIGNKHALATAKRLQSWPWILERLQRVAGVPVKFIHIYRNPYDCIATNTLKDPQRLSLEENIERYAQTCETVEWVKTQTDSIDILDVQHEAFVGAPHEHLRRIYRFAGVDASEDLVNACASIVHPTPNRTREKVEWTPTLCGKVERIIERWPYLQKYGFDA